MNFHQHQNDIAFMCRFDTRLTLFNDLKIPALEKGHADELIFPTCASC